MIMLSRRDIEKLSRKVLLSYLRHYDTPLTCIDPVDFADKMCGIHFEFADMSPSGQVLGLTAFGEIEIKIPCKNQPDRVFQLDGKTAYIDQALVDAGHMGRLNFTMMHEAAHKILGLVYPEEYNFERQPVIYRLAEERCSRPITNWPEWQTNVLTSCLLLPRELILKQMQQFGLGERIKMLNRVFAPREYEQFSLMADALGVSKTALSIRLSYLGLIDRNDFYDPYALVNVYMDDDEVA